MPLGGPAIASLGIFQFLWVWNDMLVALVFADSEPPPITVALQQQVRQFGNNIDVLAPGAFVSMVIPLVVFFAFQRQFVSGRDGGRGQVDASVARRHVEARRARPYVTRAVRPRNRAASRAFPRMPHRRNPIIPSAVSGH